MAFLRRNIRSASQQAKSTAYKTFVRPTLEYASTVWTPHDTDSNQLEMVQRRAARFVKSDYSRTSSVTAMRQDLGWDTLQQRRDQARLSMMYRITHQQVDIPAEPQILGVRFYSILFCSIFFYFIFFFKKFLEFFFLHISIIQYQVKSGKLFRIYRKQ